MSETILSNFKVEGTEIFLDGKIDKKVSKDPEVVEKAIRRRFTSEYKSAATAGRETKHSKKPITTGSNFIAKSTFKNRTKTFGFNVQND